MDPNWFSEESHYGKWRLTRIRKLESILGEDWWLGKTVLELACGYGHIGAMLQERGAKVTFTEGRKEYLPIIRSQAKGSPVIELDQDKPWNLKKKFDLVLHWGVLYHLKEWEKDLVTAIRHGTLLSLDSEVTDSDNPNFEIANEEKGFDQALHGIGVRPSPVAIERTLRKYAKSFKRYDDEDLNINFMTYSWKSGEIRNEWKNGYRRFWMVEC